MNNIAKSRSLFHYTNSDCLLGILGSGSLFASHYSFLNDKSEGNVLREILLPLLEAETRTFVPKLIEEGIINPNFLLRVEPTTTKTKLARCSTQWHLQRTR